MSTLQSEYPEKLSEVIAPELEHCDCGSVDLRPWRASIRSAMRMYGTDPIGGAMLAAYKLGTHCRLDDVMPGGRLRKALDEMTEKR